MKFEASFTLDGEAQTKELEAQDLSSALTVFQRDESNRGAENLVISPIDGEIPEIPSTPAPSTEPEEDEE
jgi:hypothetical protein